MNSSTLSHNLDSRAGLADFVRLSFCKKHPMMYVALKDGRISKAVVLEIKLEVVSRPGVLFCEINAASTAAKVSEDPTVIHFETVKADSQRGVAKSEQRFYQGEVLVPDLIPPHLIKIPKVDAFGNCLELPGLAECALKDECGGLFKAELPKPRVLSIDSLSAGVGKSTHETCAAPKVEACGSAIVPALAPASSVRNLLPTSPFPASATGSVVAIKADGDCCYHLCGVIGGLMLDPDAVKSGFTLCLPTTTSAARDRIMRNINEYVSFVKSFCCEESEVDGALLEKYGELVRLCLG
jgi:hypothetical protein